MIYLLFFLMALLLLWHLLRKEEEEKELVKDPQCGVYIPKDRALKADIGGRTLYFCSRLCLESYRKGSGA